jgi:hypothetical protein
VCPLFRVNHQESSALFFALSPSASSFHRRGSYCIAGIQCLKTKHNFLSTFTTMDGCILFSNNIVILWASTRWERGLLFLDSQEPNDMDLSFRLPTLCSPSCLLPGRAIFPPKSLQMVIIYRHHHYLSSYIFSKPPPPPSKPLPTNNFPGNFIRNNCHCRWTLPTSPSVGRRFQPTAFLVNIDLAELRALIDWHLTLLHG